MPKNIDCAIRAFNYFKEGGKNIDEAIKVGRGVGGENFRGNNPDNLKGYE